jgi:hypothetical protein
MRVPGPRMRGGPGSPKLAAQLASSLVPMRPHWRTAAHVRTGRARLPEAQNQEIATPRSTQLRPVETLQAWFAAAAITDACSAGSARRGLGDWCAARPSRTS